MGRDGRGGGVRATASAVAARAAGPLYASVIEGAVTSVVVAGVAGTALSLRGTPLPAGSWGWPALARGPLRCGTMPLPDRNARESVMRSRAISLALALIGASTVATAVAGDGRSAVDSSVRIGLDMSRLDREVTVAGSKLQADGSVAGVHAHWQSGAGLRLSGSLQGGSVDYTVPSGAEQTETAVRADVAATLGWDAAGTRVFAGLGGEGLSTDSPFGSGNRTSTSVYLPFGLARGARIHPDWYATVRFEGRFVLAGNERFDSLSGGDDVDLERYGGWGAELAAQFEHVAAPITAEPYLRYVEPSDTETDTVSGVAVRGESPRYLAAGLRLTWPF